MTEELQRIAITDQSPRAIARRVIDELWLRDGIYSLRRYGQDWYEWRTCIWEKVSDEYVNARIWSWMDEQVVWTTTKKVNKKTKVEGGADIELGEERDTLKPMNPRPAKVSEAIEAIKSYVLIEGTPPPCWIDAAPHLPPPSQIIACSDTLVDALTGTPHPISPNWFTFSSGEYPYNPTAECPTWDRYLQTTFEAMGSDRQACTDLLQEWFGYVLVPDNSHQKMMWFIGPPGTGKSTAFHALGAIVGSHSVFSTTLSKLSGSFSLAPAVGKLLIVMPDCHLTRNADSMACLEICKAVVGGDPVGVNRKHRDELPNVRLAARITMGMNTVPRLPDESGSLRRRLLVLNFNREFGSSGDRLLWPKLMAERPGILNWAILGLRRLHANGTFTEPQSSKDAVASIMATVAPEAQFVREWCETGSMFTEDLRTLCTAYMRWQKARGVNPDLDMSPQTLLFRLKQSNPTLVPMTGGGTLSAQRIRGLRLNREIAEVREAC